MSVNRPAVGSFGAFTYTPVGFDDESGKVLQFTGRELVGLNSHPNLAMFQRTLSWISQEIESHDWDSYNEFIDTSGVSYLNNGQASVSLYHPDGNKTITPTISGNSEYIPIKSNPSGDGYLYKPATEKGDQYHNIMWANTDIHRQMNDIYYGMARLMRSKHEDTHPREDNSTEQLPTQETYYWKNESFDSARSGSPVHAVQYRNDFNNHKNETVNIDSVYKYYPNHQPVPYWTKAALGTYASYPFTQNSSYNQGGAGGAANITLYGYESPSSTPANSLYVGSFEEEGITYDYYFSEDPLTGYDKTYNTTINNAVSDGLIDGLPFYSLIGLNGYSGNPTLQPDEKHFFSNLSDPLFTTEVRLLDGVPVSYFNMSSNAVSLGASAGSLFSSDSPGFLGGTNQSMNTNFIPGSDGTTYANFLSSIGSGYNPVYPTWYGGNLPAAVNSYNQTHVEPYAVSGYQYQAYKQRELEDIASVVSPNSIELDDRVCNFYRMKSRATPNVNSNGFEAYIEPFYSEDGTNNTQYSPRIDFFITYDAEHFYNSPCIYTYLGKYNLKNKYGLKQRHLQCGLNNLSSQIDSRFNSNTSVDLKFGRVADSDFIDDNDSTDTYVDPDTFVASTLDVEDIVNEVYGLDGTSLSDRYIFNEDANDVSGVGVQPVFYMTNTSINTAVISSIYRPNVQDPAENTHLKSLIRNDNGRRVMGCFPSSIFETQTVDIDNLMTLDGGEWCYFKYDAGEVISPNYLGLFENIISDYESDIGITFNNLYERLKTDISSFMYTVRVDLGRSLYNGFSYSDDIVREIYGDFYVNTPFMTQELAKGIGSGTYYTWNPDDRTTTILTGDINVSTEEYVRFFFDGTSFIAGVHVEIRTFDYGFGDVKSIICATEISPNDIKDRIQWEEQTINVVFRATDAIVDTYSKYVPASDGERDWVLGDTHPVLTSVRNRVRDYIQTNEAVGFGQLGTSVGYRTGFSPIGSAEYENTLIPVSYFPPSDSSEAGLDLASSTGYFGYAGLEFETRTMSYSKYVQEVNRISSGGDSRWLYEDAANLSWLDNDGNLRQGADWGTGILIKPTIDVSYAYAWLKRSFFISTEDRTPNIIEDDQDPLLLDEWTEGEGSHGIDNVMAIPSDPVQRKFWIGGEGAYNAVSNSFDMSDGFVYEPFVDLRNSNHNYSLTQAELMEDRRYASGFGLIELDYPIGGNLDNNLTSGE